MRDKLNTYFVGKIVRKDFDDLIIFLVKIIFFCIKNLKYFFPKFIKRLFWDFFI